jgi:Tol biopolymer transport system component
MANLSPWSACRTPHSGDARDATIQIVDIATGRMRGLTGHDSLENQPTFSPDGTHIAYWQPRDGDSGNVNEIHVAPASGGAGRSITNALDRNAARSIWMPDGKSLLVAQTTAAAFRSGCKPLDGAARKLDVGQVSPASAFWVDVAVGKEGAIAFIATDPQRPAELFYMPSPTAAP